MPKVSNKINYETNYVSFYKFVCKDNDISFTYVGHTTNFACRKSCHKHDCNNINRKSYNINLYVFIREHGGFDNWNMIEIHKQLCNDKRDAERIEQELLEQQEYKLNTIRAFITEEEKQQQRVDYLTEHKEEISEKYRIYYIKTKKYQVERYLKYYTENQESIKLRRVENREKTAERGKIYRAKNKEKEAKRHAKYNAENKDKKAEKYLKYYTENQESIKLRRVENREKTAERGKIYRAENKEKIAERKRIYYIKQKLLKEAQLNPETNADI